MTEPFPFPFPLPTLLGRVQAMYAAEYDRRLHEIGLNHLSLSLGTNVMRHLHDTDGTRVSDLVEASGVSKQAISQQVAYLAEHGYVTIEPDPEDRRAKRVHLTDAGRDSRLRVRPVFADLERDWHDRFGADDVRALRSILESILRTTGDTGLRPQPKAGGRIDGP